MPRMLIWGAALLSTVLGLVAGLSRDGSSSSESPRLATSKPDRLPWPVESFKLYRSFGTPQFRFNGAVHHGIDLEVEEAYTEVRASEAGRVVLVDYAEPRGKGDATRGEVAIQSGSDSNRRIRYVHIDPDTIRFTVGEWVEGNEVIGEVAYRPEPGPDNPDGMPQHLHLELGRPRIDLQSTNPFFKWQTGGDPELVFEPIIDTVKPTFDNSRGDGILLVTKAQGSPSAVDASGAHVSAVEDILIDTVDRSHLLGAILPPRTIEVQLVWNSEPTPRKFHVDLSLATPVDFERIYSSDTDHSKRISIKLSEMKEDGRAPDAPFVLPPGDYSLTATLHDRSGLPGWKTVEFQIAAP